MKIKTSRRIPKKFTPSGISYVRCPNFRWSSSSLVLSVMLYDFQWNYSCPWKYGVLQWCYDTIIVIPVHIHVHSGYLYIIKHSNCLPTYVACKLDLSFFFWIFRSCQLKWFFLLNVAFSVYRMQETNFLSLFLALL